MGRRGFTIIELLIVIAVAVLTIGIILPMLGSPRKNTRQMQNSTQLRGVHSGLVLFAQNNNQYYPGFNSEGERGDSVAGHEPLSVEARFTMLLEDNYFTSEYIISPAETKSVFEAGSQSSISTENFSYAMLALTGEGARIGEWRETSNSNAAVLGDRAIATAEGITSVHTLGKNNGTWRGSVGWNDNHVTFESDQVVPTEYASVLIEEDNIFEAASDDDAAMAYKGTESLIDQSQGE